ncbi:polymer-forming cytoskeletal protein [Tenacibaculum sp. IB213877]|uniref:bactofilin family protein n=1 Tax=Tenacibaculum sp. IB213877 TaxID=3097351 RepID=UPI002A5A744A|nr:polymer-forming cytoskeletal protein [Tenacibaculum sp. IB213877]MDY0780575.1 polymer-forming cytoskeletal protein [Tenacibaculum sp. IB213877]
MFSTKSKKEVASVKGTCSRNVIGPGTKIIGDLISDGDFRIDGVLEGTLKTNGRVIIGQEGFIKGNVECTNADVEGKFSGEFVVSQTLTAKSTANITGSVIVGQISTEPGASFNATCNMKGAVKELSKDSNDKKELKQKTA